MKILGPNDEVLAEKSKLLFEDVTCGQCARLIDRDEYAGFCLPPSTKWQVGLPVMHKMSKDEPIDGCECFKRDTVEGLPELAEGDTGT